MLADNSVECDSFWDSAEDSLATRTDLPTNVQEVCVVRRQLLAFLRTDGSIGFLGDWSESEANKYDALVAPAGNDFIDIDCGTSVCGVRANGTVECWGGLTDGP